MAKKQALSVTLDPEVLAYLDEIARKDRRSKSAMVEIILTEHAERNGKNLPVSGYQINLPLTAHSEV